MDIKIYVAAHKPYRMPEDSMYIPMCVGAVRQEPFCEVTDATGDNISQKNPYYCELTGLYWMWKNADAEYLGLVHYRRHFAGQFAIDKWKRIIIKSKMSKVLKTTDVVVPMARHYVIETRWSQYAHAHHVNDLIKVRECISQLYPEYLYTFDKVMKRTTGHTFNMLVMRREMLHHYCAWLFTILFALEKCLDVSKYTAYDSRVFGFVGERLLDVWLEKNEILYKELPIINLESQHWPRKIVRFFQRKLQPYRP